MRQLTCLMEELDERTHEYLRTVRAAKGQRCPGLYFAGKNPWPIIALIVGPIIALVFVVMGFNSIKDAWATALLQTAGVMLGGWMVVYALRRFMGRGSQRYAGFFSYFDPHHVYRASGEQVEILDVNQAIGVTAQGAGSGLANVRFESESGTVMWRGLTLQQAELVQDFYSARDWIRQKDETGKNLSSAVLGGAAKEFALTEELPRSYEDVNLEVEAVPEQVEKARKAIPSLMKYLIILGIGIAVYAGFASLDRPLRDDMAWSDAQENGVPGYRAYLLDDRNTRHREEAQKKLADAYEPAIQKVKSAANPTPLRDGMVQILESLKTAGQPVVTIRIKNDPSNNIPLTDYELRTIAENIGDSLGLSIGEKLISFLIPEDDENPHFEVVAMSTAQGIRKCEVILRTKPDGAPLAKGMVATAATVPNGGLNGNPNFGLGNTDTINAVKTAVLNALVGEVQAPLPALPADGDW